jgi:hypothetical protein
MAQTIIRRWKRSYSYIWQAKPIAIQILKCVDLVSMTSKSLLDEQDYKLIRKYAARMKIGDRFPLIEVNKMRNGKYFIGDGNTRFRAWRSLCYKFIPVAVYAD